MTFSVVIPVYNGAATIARAVESVLAQSRPADEVIVVDDASSDDTLQTLRARFGDKVLTVSLPVNRGSGAARNAGMDVATGDYIAFLDADDSWHTEKLRIVSEALSANPGVAFLYHLSTSADFSHQSQIAYTGMEKVPAARLLAGNFIHTPCVVIRNESGFRFASSMRYMEDYDLWLRIAMKHGVYRLGMQLTRLYRPVGSAGGISARKWQMRKGEMQVYMRLARRNVLFAFLLPLLLANSLAKHLLKMVAGIGR